MPDSLKLVDYSDRELLNVVLDAADSDGYSDAADVAERLGLTSDRPASNVGSRLAWLRRYGAVEAISGSKRERWKLTPIGELIVAGRLSARDQEAIERIGPDKLLLAVRALATKSVSGPEPAHQLARREFRRIAVLGATSPTS